MMKQRLLYLLVLVAILGSAQGQALIYRPVNPSFGGNTFNYSWMLSSATAQDKTKDPATLGVTTTTNSSQSTLNSFAESLQRQLLSRITSDVISKQFGESTLKAGTYSFGDYQVEITNGVDGIQIRIVDTKGGETTVTVPYF